MKRTSTVRPVACVRCKAALRDDVTDLVYDYGDFTIVVKDVPVTVCDDCDEQYVDGPLGAMVGHFVAKVAKKYAPLVEQNEEFRGTEVLQRYAEAKFEKSRAAAQLVYA